MLAIYAATPSTKKLFHGSAHELKGGYVRKSVPSHPLVDLKQEIVCAGISRAHAAAYGFKSKRYSSSIDGRYESPVVIIGADSKNFFDTLRTKKTYIAELPVDGFKEGVFERAPQDGGVPLEWFSREDTAIQNPEALPLNNEDVLKLGVQLFIVDNKTLFACVKKKDIFEQLQFCLDAGGEWVNRQRTGYCAASWLLNRLSPHRPTQDEIKPVVYTRGGPI